MDFKGVSREDFEGDLEGEWYFKVSSSRGLLIGLGRVLVSTQAYFQDKSRTCPGQG